MHTSRSAEEILTRCHLVTWSAVVVSAIAAAPAHDSKNVL
ncbi:hypothetical protein M3J09_007589 [Ascochyta lentis]